MAKENETTFHEEQQFRQAWVWVILILPTVILWYIAIQELVFGNPIGNSSASEEMTFVFWLGFGVLFPLFFYKLKLITQVRQDGLYIKFVPVHFSFKKIQLDNLEKHYVRIYDSIGEYGGWGIRCGLFRHGRAYNVSGDRGVQLEFKDKKRLLIGSQKPEQLDSAIEQYLNFKKKGGRII
ncbi:hypothetical protein GQ568_02115 [Patescibacteria group bacterium]|nr:hypothetical protein [Patescibacteria group bacterium]